MEYLEPWRLTMMSVTKSRKYRPDEPPRQKRQLARTTRTAEIIEGSTPRKPRLGRRESEPHSAEINHLYDVLTTNFPQDRTMWDLHHYFTLGDERIDLQFDISYFQGLHLPYELSSYHAEKHGDQRPTMVVNFLSKSTHGNDLGSVAETCQKLGIPVYVVFNPYLQHPRTIRAPFLRVYHASGLGTSYEIKELREVCLKEASSRDDDPEEEIDLSRVIDVRPDLLPFMFGIMQRERLFEGGLPRYQLILIDRRTKKRLLTKAERERRLREEAQRQAEQAQRQAERERRLRKEAQRQAEEARRQAEEARRQLEQIKKRLQELQNRQD